MNGATEPLPRRLLMRLAAEPFDRGTTGGFVSGEQLSRSLGVTRSAVWKAVTRLRALGVAIDALPRQGYRLATPCTPLSAEPIHAQLPAVARDRLERIDVRWDTRSTNADLLESPPPVGRLAVCAAEYQTEGRGRRGRQWLAAPGAALCLSWAWRFDALPAHVGSLGLVIGIAAAGTLEALGYPGVGLKWPNDLVTADGKLGGILIELVSEASGPALVVIGLGINVALDAAQREAIRAHGNRATDLRSAGSAIVDRNMLAARLVGDGLDALLRWEQSGFAPFVPAWRRLDRLYGEDVVVRHGERELHGTARGVDVDGALLLDDGRSVHRCHSGEASVRARAAEPG